MKKKQGRGGEREADIDRKISHRIRPMNV